jgi:phosphoadenosine phosphosulfate reductase
MDSIPRKHLAMNTEIGVKVPAAVGGVGLADERTVVGAPGADQLEPTEAFLAELQQHSERLETAHPRDILRWGIERFGERLTMGTAFGPEGMVILHWIAEIDPQMHVFNLDSGYQFDETLALRDEVARRYGIQVQLMQPELTIEQYEQQHGGPLYKTDPNQCCFDRKIRGLHRAITGKHAWVSAIRRDQSSDRGRAPIVGWDKKFSLVKINPLANWTKGDVWTTITEHEIPYNPLHDQGYTSIGCWPCTRAVMFGEDERAGRWSGFNKTECGLHTTD